MIRSGAVSAGVKSLRSLPQGLLRGVGPPRETRAWAESREAAGIWGENR
jgi:hypothetical protein